MAGPRLTAAASVAGALLLAPAIESPARADDSSGCNQSAPDDPEKPFDKLLLRDPFGARSAIGAYGLTLGINETDEVLGNFTGGTKHGAIYEGLTDISLKFDMRQRFQWPGVACVRAFQIRGHGLSFRNLGNLDTASSIEADPTTRLFEFWYEQYIGDQWRLRLGQQAADQEFLVSTTAKLFINSTFGWPSLPSIDLPAGGPAYPLATPAVRLRFDPTDELAILAGVFNGNPTGAPFSSNDPQRFDPSGTAFRIGDGVLAIVEARYNPGNTSDNGTYRLGAWFNSERFPSQRFASNGVSLASPPSSGSPLLLDNDYSVYGVIDQPVYTDKESGRNLNVFVRAMGAPGDRNLVNFYVDTGLAFQGPFGRKDDIVGLGFGYSQIGSGARGLDADNAALTPGYPVRSREAVVELTYEIQVADWWQLQPDFQYIVAPSAIPGQRIGNAAVLGLRSSISF
ncbi:MAG TPA: carbohydrate porin [Stellaceae bacterium]|nr:carbohydrate porin [Stellaceae bacterium]